MRKILLIAISFVIICFTVPIILTNKQEINKPTLSSNIIQENEPYVYQKFGTVRLLHKETGIIENIGMDEYLYRSSIS